jgi:pimeloyl-ACP methyl ester carboxylesterase
MQVQGADLHYQDTGGAGPAVVFSHGLLWSGSMYRFQIAAFRDRYRCIAFDFRGQGKSEVTASGYDMETLFEDAAQLIGKLAVAPVHFVGLSMGGFIGMRLAARRPELVRSLALLDTASDPEPRLKIPKYLALSLVARALGIRPVAGAAMKTMFARSFLTDPARAALREEMRGELIANHRDGATRALQGVIRRKPLEAAELARIRAPVLVLSGAEDSAVVPARSRRTAEQIPGARFIEIPRAGHTSTIEEPEAVNAALRSFWDGLPH